MSANLLLEVSPVLLINEDEVEIIPSAEFLVHLTECRSQVEASEE